MLTAKKDEATTICNGVMTDVTVYQALVPGFLAKRTIF